MALTLSQVRTLIAAKVQAVTGVGRVYEYRRLVTTESEILADMVSGALLNFWTVTPAEGNAQERVRHPGTHDKVFYRYEINAYYAASAFNETETTFVSLVEAVMATFETGGKDLGGQVNECWPAQCTELYYRTFANVLCHHAKLTIQVREHPGS
jgi:hypothetical protein